MIKLLYKGKFYKEITKQKIDYLLDSKLKNHKFGLTEFVINVAYELLGLNIYEYGYGREDGKSRSGYIINNKDHFIINLRDYDYKMLSREEKISDLLNNK
jgi:hypothetical protein